LCGDFPNLRFRDVPTLKLSHIAICMATSPSKNDKPCTMWYDDVVVATIYIGPMFSGKVRQTKR
jgi:hypothetical protein